MPLFHHLLAPLLLLALSTQAYDQGFELLFTSNQDEVLDLPVYFDKPLLDSLNGTLYHNGLGMFELGERIVSHLFDAFAKMSSWKLEGGSKKALFTTKFISTGYYNDSMYKTDIAPYMLFANPSPNFDAIEWLEKFKNGQDNVNVNLLRVGEDLVAVGDFARVYTIDEERLTTKQRVDAELPGVSRLLPANFDLSTSHPVPEYGTNNWINVIIQSHPIWGPCLHLVRCADAEKREIIVSIGFEALPYMHSFISTEKYVVLFTGPATFDLIKLLRTGEPMKAFTWREGQPTMVYVVEIATRKVQVLNTDPVFPLHFANAFTMPDGRIAVDVITYPNIDNLSAQMLVTLRDPILRNNIHGEKALLKRYILNLHDQSVQVHTFPTKPSTVAANKFDFPVFNENYRFKQYCYIYGVAQKADGKMMSKWVLVKKDLCDPQGDKLWYRENHYPGEPWFVPREGAVEEDDGHLLVVMLDGVKRVSYLAVFDARSLELVNTAYLPMHLPMNLHGRFLD